MPIIRSSRSGIEALPPARRRGKLADGRIVTERAVPAGGKWRSVSELRQAIRGGELDAHSVSLAEERDLRRWVRTAEAKLAAAVDALEGRGSHCHARRAAYQYRRSLPARLRALMSTRPKWLRARPGMSWAEAECLRRVRLDRILALAPEIASYSRPAVASVRRKFKRGGGFRLICSFDWGDLARQRLLTRSLFPFASLHRSQFMLTLHEGGRGRTAACNALLRRLEGRGDDLVFMQFDVRNYFGTISHQWVEERLGVDRSLVRRHIHTGGMMLMARGNATVRPSDGELCELGQRGLPQGSAASSCVAETVMADIIGGLPDHLQDAMLVYSDNLGVLVPRGEEAAVEELIRGAFACHGAGPFEIACSRPIPVTQEFKFLGQWWRVVDGRPTRYVPTLVAEDWLLGIGTSILNAGRAELRRLVQVVRGQCAEWSFWDGMPAVRDELQAMIALQTGLLVAAGDGFPSADLVPPA